MPKKELSCKFNAESGKQTNYSRTNPLKVTICVTFQDKELVEFDQISDNNAHKTRHIHNLEDSMRMFCT